MLVLVDHGAQTLNPGPKSPTWAHLVASLPSDHLIEADGLLDRVHLSLRYIIRWSECSAPLPNHSRDWQLSGAKVGLDLQLLNCWR